MNLSLNKKNIIKDKDTYNMYKPHYNPNPKIKHTIENYNSYIIIKMVVDSIKSTISKFASNFYSNTKYTTNCFRFLLRHDIDL